MKTEEFTENIAETAVATFVHHCEETGKTGVLITNYTVTKEEIINIISELISKYDLKKEELFE